MKKIPLCTPSIDNKEYEVWSSANGKDWSLEDSSDDCSNSEKCYFLLRSKFFIWNNKV